MAGTLVLDTLQNGAGTASTSADNVIRGCAKAWVNFNGSSGASPVIRASYNVSSVTRNSTGDYTITFSTALADANYASLFTPGGQETTSTGNFDMPRRTITPTTTSTRVLYSNGNQDTLYGSVAIFR
jgi:hypothetical protein